MNFVTEMKYVLCDVGSDSTYNLDEFQPSTKVWSCAH